MLVYKIIAVALSDATVLVSYLLVYQSITPTYVSLEYYTSSTHREKGAPIGRAYKIFHPLLTWA